VRVAALAACAALVLTACGDALAEFRDDLRPLEERASEQRSQIAVELRTATLGSRSDARELRARSAQLSEIFAEIAEIDPPDDYEKPFAAYVRANDMMVRGLEQFADDLVAGDPAGVRRSARRVVRQLGQSQRARLRWLE
jgi:hypothetical protein